MTILFLFLLLFGAPAVSACIVGGRAEARLSI